MAASAPCLISVFSSPQELGASLAQLVAQRAACCLAGARARFALGLSGGSLVSMLARDLPAAAAPAGPASLARWTVGFCDERLVPFEHAESTYGLYRVRATGAAGGHAEPAAPTAGAPPRGPRRVRPMPAASACAGAGRNPAPTAGSPVGALQPLVVFYPVARRNGLGKGVVVTKSGPFRGPRELPAPPQPRSLSGVS